MPDEGFGRKKMRRERESYLITASLQRMLAEIAEMCFDGNHPLTEARMRGRSYSYSPSPPRYRSRRPRSPSPRGRYGGRARDLPTSLLVRNLHHGCRPEDLRRRFEEFGPLKDVYLPRDYYSGEPRGFGFVQYIDPADAEEAKYYMDGQVLLARELTVVFAEENRKKPHEMRSRDRFRQFLKWILLFSGVAHMIGGGHHHDDMDDLIPAAQAITPLHLGEGIIRGQFHLEIDITDIERGHTRGHLMAQRAGARTEVGALIRAVESIVNEKQSRSFVIDLSRVWSNKYTIANEMIC
ncbi:hypothetical protein RJ639_004656 [Escallonia herrerae]|uniref:RRM domain-containing protein n=1 Tax=Escallonia herrerae TaxID=1293975 RepID=A0AA88W1H5_9ASTE|nr:hypothetical protein RJ639_004656 [Escallonia herrerae]